MDEKLAEAKPVEPLPKKTRWFQFHLITLLVLTLVMGAVLWLSLQKHFRFESKPMGWIECGWPLAAYREYAGVMSQEQISKLPSQAQAEAPFLNEWDRFYLENVGIVLGFPANKNVVVLGLIIDVISLLAILGLTAILSEFLIRRREGRKPPAPP